MPVDLNRRNDTRESIEGVSFLFQMGIREFNITRKAALNSADKEEV